MRLTHVLQQASSQGELQYKGYSDMIRSSFRFLLEFRLTDFCQEVILINQQLCLGS